MAVNFASQVYSPTYDVFARPITITPTASQPEQPAYSARGIYSTQSIDVLAEDSSLVSDQRSIIDIIEVEFAVLPAQGDLVDVPASAGLPALGTFQIVDTNANGGGETTLSIRRWMVSLP